MSLDPRELAVMRLREAILTARDRGASDLHIADGESPVMRIDGTLVHCSDDKLAPGDLREFLNMMLDQRALDSLERVNVCDDARHDERGGALRFHAFRDRGGLRCAVRLLPEAVPTLASLDAPPIVREFALRRNGLILVVGPTGSGKTTLIAAMINALNSSTPRHIVTLEDPIEYVHRADRCLIAQCEVGRDTNDFACGLHGILRADPDVIVIGELREKTAMQAALLAAETGHLVIASLHTLDAAHALDRIVDSFDLHGREQIRVQLSQTLTGIVALRLVPRQRGAGRRAAVEILVATDAVRNLVRETKTSQLRSAIQTGRAFGMQTLEMHLSRLIAQGEISVAAARDAAVYPSDLRLEERVAS